MTRGFWSHPLVQLTLVRLREFYREPEAVFWVHLFPLLMILGLGWHSIPKRAAGSR